ncbi:gamma-glutamyltransferase family protein [Pseudoprimorskyibacter insulae]|uniref:Gamma-glutamyltransferase YwrD n=1 Tax=Pseudoprimorskyibacter insulae TaxID=1695997 RepID=A0A2R8AV18_9RHOB|nr:gamma-glutamyltransferase family protein [Pseudoprimorskyibacter insulae]SPF79883.1 Putative gamma-glutamyltransferase YwrD [Pseudoprimorskyibacter insulae]
MRDFQFPGRSPVLAENGMCATSHPLAASAAIDVLKSGGNAMDAAIAGAVLLGVCEPQMTGIGGDCFALISHAGTEDVIGMNGSGRAPAAATADMLRAQGHSTVPILSPHAVTIPGAVDAFCTMSDRWGRLGIADSLAPAIRYFDEGVPVAPRVAFDWAGSTEQLQGHARDWYLNSGAAYRTGEKFALTGQAEVLRRIAKDGRSAFYEGEVAEDMLATLNALGGVHSAEDFAGTACTQTIPISGTYGNREVMEHPPNGQGATALLILNILSRFDLKGMDPFGAERAHIEAEATKLAYDARNRIIADPDENVRVAHMLSQETADALAALINPKAAMGDPAPLTESVHKETIYITVVDKDRMAVSLIYSIFHSFGSGIASEKFGILFQNRGAGFRLEPGHPNELAGGKRPMHTIIPGMMREGGRVIMPFGVMGGQYQPNGHARLISNIETYGMDPQAAIDGARSFAENGVLKVERGYRPEVAAELASLGHKVVEAEGPIGGAQAIFLHESGVLEGASDPRKDGCALGY